MNSINQQMDIDITSQVRQRIRNSKSIGNYQFVISRE